MQFIKRMKVTQVDEGIYMMLNGLTGTIDIIDETIYQLYLSWKDSPYISSIENPEMYENFISRGYLMKSGEEDTKIADIYHQLETNLHKARSRVDPTFLLTYNCNFRCTYCYEKQLQEKGKEYLLRKMTPEMVNGFFSSFDKQQMKIGEITLYGGEPLLPDNLTIVKAILAQAIQRERPINVITNGYTLNQYAPLLATAQIKTLQVTLDGDQVRHDQSRFLQNGEGTFAQILAGLIKAKEYALPIVLRCNVKVDEEGQVERLLAALEGTGLKEYPKFQLYIAPVASAESKYNCGHDFLADYLKKIDQYLDRPIVMKQMLKSIHRVAINFISPEKWQPTYVYCAAHVGQQIFDPWGHIYPCQILVGDESHSIGNFDEYGHVNYNKNYKNWQSRTIQNLTPCRDCNMALFCGGGCGMQSIKRHGHLFAPNCETMHELWDLFLPFLYQRFLKE